MYACMCPTVCNIFQSGQKVPLAPEDRRALVMGLALHDTGKAAMSKVWGAANRFIMHWKSMCMLHSRPAHELPGGLLLLHVT
jgi:hypothetical protein